VSFRIVKILLKTKHILSETIHKKGGWTEISRSQPCRGEVASHRVGKTIGRVHFETVELLVFIISDFFKIVGNVWIHIIISLNFLFLLFNNAGINLR